MDEGTIPGSFRLLSLETFESRIISMRFYLKFEISEFMRIVSHIRSRSCTSHEFLTILTWEQMHINFTA